MKRFQSGLLFLIVLAGATYYGLGWIKTVAGGAAIYVQLASPDTDDLIVAAQELKAELAAYPGVTDIADPLGGSWAIESLTEEIVQRARAYLARIDDLGGAISGLEKGFQQKEIADAAYAEQMAIESGDRKIVGINAHRADSEPPTDLLTVDPEGEHRQVERLRAFRASRSPERVEAALRSLTDAAGGSSNMMHPILECARTGCTVGEIADGLREVFGEHQDSDLG